MSGDLFAHKNSIAMNISRDMAIIHGMVKPTAEEVERYNAESRESWARAVVDWQEADAFRVSLAAVTDPVARVVLDMHRPIDDDTAECHHCTSGEAGDHDPWPCDTVEAVASALGLEPPAGWLGRRPGAEPHVMPPEGYEPLNLHRLSGFVDAFAVALDDTVFHGMEPKP